MGIGQSPRRRCRLGPCRRPHRGELGACGASPLARSRWSMSDSQSRRRWVTFGEVIGLAALIVSALGLWISWKSTQDDKPTRVVEQKQAVPLVLRGSAERDGRELAIT